MASRHEEDAKEKKCPFMLGNQCLGSECMAWEYDSRMKACRVSAAGKEEFTPGYCGLINKP